MIFCGIFRCPLDAQVRCARGDGRDRLRTTWACAKFGEGAKERGRFQHPQSADHRENGGGGEGLRDDVRPAAGILGGNFRFILRVGGIRDMGGFILCPKFFQGAAILAKY